MFFAPTIKGVNGETLMIAMIAITPQGSPSPIILQLLTPEWTVPIIPV